MSAPDPLTVLSLFSGIGGLELGLERAGMTVVGQVEINEFCRSVLARHWPKVDRHDDVRTAPAWWASRPRPRVDLVCGGFPCQPFSAAGWGLGIDDPRWGWPWFRDVLVAVRPRYVLIENVPRLLAFPDAFAQILDDLSHLGFDVEWSVVSGCALDAPRVRKRLLILAHPHGLHGAPRLGIGQQGRAVQAEHRNPHPWTDPVERVLETATTAGRVADGLPPGLDAARVTALGNAVIPHITEHIGHLVLDLDRQHQRAA